MTIHAACAAVPDLPAKAFASLCESIHKNGLLQPILVNEDDEILDGKNRWRACQKVGVEPTFKKIKTPADPFWWAVNINLPRLRKSGQWALAAARAATATSGGDRQSTSPGRASDENNNKAIAKAFGISVTAVKRAKFVDEHGVDELKVYLEDGEITLYCAEWAAHASKEEQTLAAAVSVEAVRELAASLRAKNEAPPPPLRDVQVLDGITGLVLRWPSDVPIESLVANLEKLARDLKKRRAA
jgi:hypothetical protein